MAMTKRLLSTFFTAESARQALEAKAQTLKKQASIQ